MIKVLGLDVMNGAIGEEETFDSVLFGNSTQKPNAIFVGEGEEFKKWRRDTRRMNRVSRLGYYSATSAMENSNLLEKEWDPFRFGTILATANPGYDNLISLLQQLYTKGAEAISPIEFTYSVGNSLFSGITMKYKLRGPSVSIPYSEPTVIAKHYFDESKADFLLVSSYNALQPESLHYLSNVSHANFKEQDVNPLYEEAEGYTIRENFVSLILGKGQKAEGVSLINVYSQQKRDNHDWNQSFDVESFISVAEKTLGNISTSEVDVVFSCACGNPELDLKEYNAIKRLFPEASIITIGGYFGTSQSGNFLLNSAAAIRCLEEQKLPERFLMEGNGSHDIRTAFVYGYNELGNIIGGVWSWN